jgi:uncharacterized membrane-anchored protein
MENSQKVVFSKVPEVTLIFWITKIFATTLGETGGDSVSIFFPQKAARQGAQNSL